MFFAHRVQKPEDKPNHALVVLGDEGIGKDSMLKPLKRAVGPWNFGDVGPTQMLGNFNPHLENVVLRINEARDLGIPELARPLFHPIILEIEFSDGFDAGCGAATLKRSNAAYWRRRRGLIWRCGLSNRKLRRRGMGDLYWPELPSP
jgi:hypothetical protein